MGHYISLHGIIDDLMKIHVGVIYLDFEHWQWWKQHKNSHGGYISWKQFASDLYEHYELDTHYLGYVSKLKQYGIVEKFISTFEQLTFQTEGKSDTFSRECFISGLK